MQRSFLFLGTGGSMGVPVIGCTCAVCTSKSPFNRRGRPSGLLKIGKKVFLIDVGPDFREQALCYGVSKLTGVLFTHSHFDHIGGFDDLRAFFFTRKKKVPCLASKETFEEIKIRYHYMMPGPLQFQVLSGNFGKTLFQGEKFHFLSYFQNEMRVIGYRHGDFAYVTDIREYEEEVFASLKGVKTLVLSALRQTPSRAHFSLEEAVDFAKKVKAKKVWLTHIAHELDHEEAHSLLPPNIRLAYDGLEINL